MAGHVLEPLRLLELLTARLHPTFLRSLFGKSKMPSVTRKLLLTELPDDSDGDEAELIPDENTHETAVFEPPALKKFLQAECLAAEFQKLRSPVLMVRPWNRSSRTSSSVLKLF